MTMALKLARRPPTLPGHGRIGALGQPTARRVSRFQDKSPQTRTTIMAKMARRWPSIPTIPTSSMPEPNRAACSSRPTVVRHGRASARSPQAMMPASPASCSIRPSAACLTASRKPSLHRAMAMASMKALTAGQHGRSWPAGRAMSNTPLSRLPVFIMPLATAIPDFGAMPTARGRSCSVTPKASSR